ncbi:MAG: hypothetical protein WCP35_08655 [Verrucomicrobiota bacterium]
MARLIESSLWVDFTRSKSPLALKTLIQPWILDPLACLCEPIAFEVLRHASPQEQKWLNAQFVSNTSPATCRNPPPPGMRVKLRVDTGWLSRFQGVRHRAPIWP